METNLISKVNLKKNSNSIFLINTFAFLFFIIYGYISIIINYYSDLFLNQFGLYPLNYKYIYQLIFFKGFEMDVLSMFLFYFSPLIVCVINFISLIKYFFKKSNLEKYYLGKYSQLIFLPKKFQIFMASII